ncbi:MAG: hypothetical protein QOJ99_752 [Bryobacterales bacterium]|jgi:hypothetical protein|nr:hypothetical protein [Bryobacterales bacterium]
MVYACTCVPICDPHVIESALCACATQFCRDAVVSLAILIHRCVYKPDDWMGKALSWKPFAFPGVLSYSIYLWQQLLTGNSRAWMNAVPQNPAFAALASLVSSVGALKPGRSGSPPPGQMEGGSVLPAQDWYPNYILISQRVLRC